MIRDIPETKATLAGQARLVRKVSQETRACPDSDRKDTEETMALLGCIPVRLDTLEIPVRPVQLSTDRKVCFARYMYMYFITLKWSRIL